jgi:hypothetical protein
MRALKHLLFALLCCGCLSLTKVVKGGLVFAKRGLVGFGEGFWVYLYRERASVHTSHSIEKQTQRSIVA